MCLLPLHVFILLGSSAKRRRVYGDGDLETSWDGRADVGDGDGHSGDRLDFPPGDGDPRRDFTGWTMPCSSRLEFRRVPYWSTGDRSKRLSGGTESQVEHWPRDVTIAQIQMERTGNGAQGTDWNKRHGNLKCTECHEHNWGRERPQGGGSRLKVRGWESLPQTVLICQPTDTRL